MIPVFGREKKNRIDTVANDLARDGNIAALESELGKFNPLRLKGAEQESWFHLRGIAAFRRGDHDAAFTRFQEARNAVPESGSIAFSLAQEHEYRGEAAEMFALFDLFRFPSLPSAYALAQARYAYLWGEFARGIAYVRPILDAHFNLRIADDTFLYLRQMPFFSQTWAYMAALHELQGELDVVREITIRAKAQLQDYDVMPLESWLNAVSSGDYSQFIDETHRTGGYSRVRAVVLSARRAASIKGGLATIDDVVLSENDFPWLADILLIARAELAHKCADSSEETYIQAFLKRQAMLFEPDHAFNFRLLEYQERLRPRYQGLRTRGTA